MEGTDSGGGRRIGREAKRWMDGWHGGDFTFIPEMHVCDEASTATCTGRKAKTERGSFS